MPMKNHFSLLLLFLTCFLCFSSCYQQESQTPDAWDLTQRQIDSISFSTTHHYSQNYNFYVKVDSLCLTLQQPKELLDDMTYDTIVVRHNDRLVVADILSIPTDTVDSVWVRVARDQQTMGWTRESSLLSSVAPDDPISQFIDYFSNKHLLIFLAFLVVVLAAYGIRKLMRLQAKIVHFNDINSFYPTLLCLLVASSAVLYSTIQLVAPESWRHYYYHPTLNPFALPFHLGIFILSVWMMIIVAIAAFDDVRRQLTPTDAFFYYFGLVGVCAVCYVVFSVTTLYYIGYPLLAAYFVFALRRYFRQSRTCFLCGNCGQPLRQKGRCPHCGVLNE